MSKFVQPGATVWLVLSWDSDGTSELLGVYSTLEQAKLRQPGSWVRSSPTLWLAGHSEIRGVVVDG